MEKRHNLKAFVKEGSLRKEKGLMVLAMIPFLFRMDRIKLLRKWSMEEKNRFSHREKATEKLVAFLNTLEPTNH